MQTPVLEPSAPTVADLKIALADFEADYFSAEARRAKRQADTLKARRGRASVSQLHGANVAADPKPAYAAREKERGAGI